MAKILVAAAPKPQEIVQRVLAGHDLIVAGTMAEAVDHLQQKPFDLIVTTVLFEDSKMYEFLQLIKSKPEIAQIPVVCARLVARADRRALEVIREACRVYGAAAFLDISDYATDAELRRTIENFLPRGSEPKK